MSLRQRLTVPPNETTFQTGDRSSAATNNKGYRAARRRQQATEKRFKYFALVEKARQVLKENDVTDSRMAPSAQEQLLNCRTRMDHLNRYFRELRTRRWLQRDIFANVQAERGDQKLRQTEQLIRSVSSPVIDPELKRTTLDQAETLLKSILPVPSGDLVDLFAMTESSVRQAMSLNEDVDVKLDVTLFNNKVAEVLYFDVEHEIDLEFLKIRRRQPNEPIGTSDEEIYSIRATPVSHKRAFMLYISMLVDQNRFDDALDVILHALVRNPLHIEARLQRIDILVRNMLMIHNSGVSRRLHRHKIREEVEICFRHTKQRGHLSKCYHTMSVLFVDEARYEDAVACILMSFLLDSQVLIIQELRTIHERLIDASSCIDTDNANENRQDDEQESMNEDGNNDQDDIYRFAKLKLHIKLLQYVFAQYSDAKREIDDKLAFQRIIELLSSDENPYGEWIQWQLRHIALVPATYAPEWSLACENIVERHIREEITEQDQPWSPVLVTQALKNYHRALYYSEGAVKYQIKLQELVDYDPMPYRQWVASLRKSTAFRTTQRLLKLQEALRSMIEKESINRMSLSKLSAVANGRGAFQKTVADKPTGLFYEIKAAMAGKGDPDLDLIDDDYDSDFSDFDDDDDTNEDDAMIIHLRDELMLRLTIQANT